MRILSRFDVIAFIYEHDIYIHTWIELYIAFIDIQECDNCVETYLSSDFDQLIVIIVNSMFTCQNYNV